MSRPALTGLVLAGGGSRRMGRDKARLLVEGEPLAVRVVRRLEAICEQVLLASGDGRRLSDLGYAEVADAAPEKGPLAGIVAGLDAAATELVAVVAVDMPHASPEVLRLLADRWHGEDVVVPSDGVRVHPLHGIYAVGAAAALRSCLHEGTHGVQAALSRLDVTVVGPDGWRHLDPGGRFLLNANAPGDLADLA